MHRVPAGQQVEAPGQHTPGALVRTYFQDDEYRLHEDRADLDNKKSWQSRAPSIAETALLVRPEHMRRGDAIVNLLLNTLLFEERMAALTQLSNSSRNATFIISISNRDVLS